MKEFTRITLNKNRGWRGLAEAKIYDNDNNEVLSSVFSFSQDVWDDLMDGYIVLCDNKERRLYVCSFEDADLLPQRHQRSVLIKNFSAAISSVNSYDISGIASPIESSHDGRLVNHYKKNQNNHTSSIWNHIGLRVIPEI